MKSAVRVGLALAGLLLTVCAVAQIPAVDAPGQTDFQSETHFLTFLGSFKTENIASATAYYKAIDPTSSKQNFTAWLVNAGFIANASQWHSTGPQIISYTPGVYGDNVVNTDAHVVVLNAADLGFVRYQFIRCKPSCTAKNPIIYTYLENYPVAPFAVGGTNFGAPGGSAFPSQAEAKAAILSAVSRPLGTFNGQSIERIADVAFEWAPPASNPTSTKYFGQLYAYIFHDSGGGVITETIGWPNDQPFLDAHLNNRLHGVFPPQFPPLQKVVAGDSFAPELDGRGVKQMPGVCLICHGGKPTALTTFDSFLPRALNQVRFGGNEETRVFAYAPSNPNELPSDFKFSHSVADAGQPVVYHLMGRVSATPVYAVTQEDVVEYFHSLQSETHRPQPLFDELNSKSLLILGCRFGGWLTPTEESRQA